jgi:thioredoxin 1
MVIDCYADWCGPCKIIAPKVVEFAKQYPAARFYKVNVDDVPDVAQELGIRAMPTFKLFKDGEVFDTVVGAKEKDLEALIKTGLQ